MARLNTLNSPQGFKQLSNFSQSMAKPSVLGSSGYQDIRPFNPLTEDQLKERAQKQREDSQEREAENELRQKTFEGLFNLYRSFTLFGQTPDENQINQLRDYVQRNVASGAFGASALDPNFISKLGGSQGYGSEINRLIRSNIGREKLLTIGSAGGMQQKANMGDNSRTIMGRYTTGAGTALRPSVEQRSLRQREAMNRTF